MRALLILLFILFKFSISGQNRIVGFEYWHDTNHELKTFYPIQTNEQYVSITGDLIVSNIPNGYHSIHFRLLDESGVWSSIATRHIHVMPIETNTLTNLRYWIGEDISPNFKLVQFTEPVSQLSITDYLDLCELDTPGQQTIYFQIQDIYGQWSSVISESVFIDEVGTKPSELDSIIGATRICANEINSFYVSQVVGATTYHWDYPASWDVTDSLNYLFVLNSDSSGVISVFATNRCGNSNAIVSQITVDVNDPISPDTIIGHNNVCFNDTVNYSIEEDINTENYNWILPQGWELIGNMNQASIFVIAKGESDTLSVFKENSCGNSSFYYLPVAVSVIPTAPIDIAGPYEVCLGDTIHLTAIVDQITDTVIWNLPSNWEIIDVPDINTVLVVVGSEESSLHVEAVNECGKSENFSKHLAIATSEPILADSIIGNSTPCVGVEEIYTISVLTSNVDIAWNFPEGWELVFSDSTSATVRVGSQSDSIEVIGFNACGASNPVYKNISPIELDQNVTFDNSSVLMASQSNAFYQWLTCPESIEIPNATSQSFNLLEFGFSEGEFAVEITYQGCTELSECVEVMISNSDPGYNYEQISILPNPNLGNFKICSNTNEIEDIQLIDLLGQIVDIRIIEENGCFNILTLKAIPGIYFLVVKGNNKTQSLHTIIK